MALYCTATLLINPRLRTRHKDRKHPHNGGVRILIGLLLSLHSFNTLHETFIRSIPLLFNYLQHVVFQLFELYCVIIKLEQRTPPCYQSGWFWPIDACCQKWAVASENTRVGFLGKGTSENAGIPFLPTPRTLFHHSGKRG